MRIQYLFDGISSVKFKSGGTSGEAYENVQLHGVARSNIESASSTSPKTDKCSKSTQPAEVDSLILQVRALFPNLGEGFVLCCLEYFNYSPEQVISTLLENNLPPHLASMDRNKVKNESKPSKSITKSKDIVPNIPSLDITSSRSNIHDGDEFDINVNDNVDISRIHKGKQRRAKNANVMLDDKTDLKTKSMQDRFAALSIVVDEELVPTSTRGDVYDDYDDEYDDTYDDRAMGENADADEYEARRPFVLPQALGGGHVTYVKEESDDESEEEIKNPLDFVRNPEEIRQEAERKRQEQYRIRRGNNPNPNRDVVGQSKGQGQQKQVLINRQHKTENKGKRSRAAADKKMSKGMF